MNVSERAKSVSAVFITFSGNCREALTHYQICFGGSLQFETFETPGFTAAPVVIGSFFSDRIVIYGSDLVHLEGRIIGNYMAVFVHCSTAYERQTIIEKLGSKNECANRITDHSQKLLEITDSFGVRWIMAV